jgi:hypothetical protein
MEQNHQGHIRAHAPHGLTGASSLGQISQRSGTLNSIIYIVGLIVVVMAVLSFVGIR